MAVATGGRKKLGEIFVDSRILSQLTVDRLVDVSKRLNKRFGALLEEMGLITGTELAKALAVQYGCQVVHDFTRFSYPRELLALIPAEVAIANCLFPLKLADRRLALAMADPTDTRIVANIAANSDLSVVPFVTTRAEVNAAIARHYFGKETPATDRARVLVVEDDKLVMAMITSMLGKQYEVLTAGDGMEAYREAVVGKPQVILTDKEMPKLGGYSLLDAIRNNPDTRSIPLILLTGTATPEEEARAFEKGFFDFIPKPVKELVLRTRVNRALQHYSQQRFPFAG
jgi:CheY-like chemotaxis protein